MATFKVRLRVSEKAETGHMITVNLPGETVLDGVVAVFGKEQASESCEYGERVRFQQKLAGKNRSIDELKKALDGKADKGLTYSVEPWVKGESKSLDERAIVRDTIAATLGVDASQVTEEQIDRVIASRKK